MTALIQGYKKTLGDEENTPKKPLNAFSTLMDFGLWILKALLFKALDKKRLNNF